MSFLRVRTTTTVAASAAAALALPAGAAAATGAPPYPVITKVTPMKVGVGDLLTIKGKGFLAGKNRNTVVFKRSGQRAVFVKAESSTATIITLHVPPKLQAYMPVTNSQPAPAVFQIRIIARRFGQRFTSRALSPTVGPSGSGTTTTPPPASAYEQCLAAAAANPSGDQDGDSLSNALEKQIGTDPCRADTDGDGMPDGYEYQSALDLNSRALPYPGKKPWPNPLDPTDANSDFDGDGLTMSQEYQLWKYAGSPFNPDGTLGAYSDGTQNTGGMMLTAGNPTLQKLDLNGDGNLTDDERDADQDGLSNIVELSTTGTQAWWANGPYKSERPYGWRPFADLSPTNPDSNGNGVLDGADDQDADGVDNYTEMQLGRKGSGLFVNPYNPCLPNPYALTCSRYVPLDSGSVYPPFDDASSSKYVGSIVPLTWPTPTAPTHSGQLIWNGHGGPQGPNASGTVSP